MPLEGEEQCAIEVELDCLIMSGLIQEFESCADRLTERGYATVPRKLTHSSKGELHKSIELSVE